MYRVAAFALAAAMAAALVLPVEAAGGPHPGQPALSVERIKNVLVARGGTCKTVSSCEEAVALWCGGYSRADGDGDGIPCENVCGSRTQVNAIKQRIGC
jgi:hypothetical protein